MKRYPGGKNAPGTWQWIIREQPPHSHYVEGCVGSGGIVRRKIPTLRTTVVDRDDGVINYWRGLGWPGLEAVHGCVMAWLRKHGPTLGEDALVYLDPPYLHATRVKKKMYRYEMTDADHQRLLDVIVGLQCRVMISGYRHAMYDVALTDWRRLERPVRTRGGTWRTECLWCNFAPAVTSGMTVAPGRGHRERDRIQQRLKRWKRNFLAMPDYERTAVLASLIEAARATSSATCVDARQK